MDAMDRAKALAEKLSLHNGDIPWSYAREIEDAITAAIREAEVGAVAKERERCVALAKQAAAKQMDFALPGEVEGEADAYEHAAYILDGLADQVNTPE
jgi:glucose-6-phosphate-specific signal transduction histidine kinase